MLRRRRLFRRWWLRGTEIRVVVGNAEDRLDGPLFFLGGHPFLSETLLDFGPQHPLLELRFHALFGRLPGHFEALVFQFHPLPGVVAFAQGDQAGSELLQDFEREAFLAGGLGQPLGGDGEVQGEPLGEGAAERLGILPAWVAGGIDLCANSPRVFAECCHQGILVRLPCSLLRPGRFPTVFHFHSGDSAGLFRRRPSTHRTRRTHGNYFSTLGAGSGFFSALIVAAGRFPGKDGDGQRPTLQGLLDLAARPRQRS
jgi:hypothetical protein